MASNPSKGIHPSSEGDGKGRERKQSLWQKLRKRVKEQGWVKRWDDNYQIDYWENTLEGRVVSLENLSPALRFITHLTSTSPTPPLPLILQPSDMDRT